MTEITEHLSLTDMDPFADTCSHRRRDWLMQGFCSLPGRAALIGRIVRKKIGLFHINLERAFPWTLLTYSW